MPNANTATFRRLPPVKVLTKPRKVCSAVFMNSISTFGSMPGEGIWQPIR